MHIIRSIVLIIVLSLNAFSGDYCKERDQFHKSYFSQVLANGYGSQNEYSLSDKLDLISSFEKNLKRYPGEPGINDFDACGMAPLHYLAMTRICDYWDYVSARDICYIFLRLGTDINQPNLYGITPLRIAANYGNYAVVDVFLSTENLKKDPSILNILFSPESYSNDQYYRDIDLFGKIEIWKSLKKSWFIDFDPDKLKYIDFRTKEIVKWIGISPETELELNSKERNIKSHLKHIHEALTKNTLEKESEKTWVFIKQSANETDNETKTEEN